MAYDDIESTFMINDAVKVSPVLESLAPNATFSVYFPPGKWVDLGEWNTIDVTNPNGSMIDLLP